MRAQARCGVTPLSCQMIDLIRIFTFSERSGVAPPTEQHCFPFNRVSRQAKTGSVTRLASWVSREKSHMGAAGRLCRNPDDRCSHNFQKTPIKWQSIDPLALSQEVPGVPGTHQVLVSPILRISRYCPRQVSSLSRKSTVPVLAPSICTRYLQVKYRRYRYFTGTQV
jgi:hypothetical protein